MYITYIYTHIHIYIYIYIYIIPTGFLIPRSFFTDTGNTIYDTLHYIIISSGWKRAIIGVPWCMRLRMQNHVSNK